MNKAGGGKTIKGHREENESITKVSRETKEVGLRMKTGNRWEVTRDA